MIRKKRFQNRVAEASWLLPMTGVVGTAVWWGIHPWTLRELACFFLFVVSAYIVSRWSTRHALLRQNSDMVTSVFALLVLLTAQQSTGIRQQSLLLLFVVSISQLTRCYRNIYQPHYAFYSFACLGLANMVHPYFILFAPVFLHVMFHQLKCLTPKTLTASVLGFALPYWLQMGLDILDIPSLTLPRTTQGITLSLPDYTAFSTYTALVFGFLAVSHLLGVVHYVRQSHQDKTSVRSILTATALLATATAALIAVFPRQCRDLLPLMAVAEAPCVAHLFAHTYTKYTNALFKVWIIVLGTLLVVSQWMPS